MYQFSSRLFRVCAVAAGVLLGASGAGVDGYAASLVPANSASEVDAHYKITLNGFDLGKFRFVSNVDQERYTINTDVELSAVLGIFHWKGETRSTGTLPSRAPKPADFLFQFASSAKSGAIKMGFGETGVETLAIEPTGFEPPEQIPLTRAHLKNVLDPLTAILAITHVDATTPCGRNMPIFDGKQRFDIDLRYARHEPLAGTKETAIVCRVKYRPVAGYTPTEEIQALSASDGIEIAFRPVSAVKLMLPQSVVIPTPVGQARLDLVQISIKAPARGQVASVD